MIPDVQRLLMATFGPLMKISFKRKILINDLMTPNDAANFKNSLQKWYVSTLKHISSIYTYTYIHTKIIIISTYKTTQHNNYISIVVSTHNCQDNQRS